jgi:protein-disulfide isomerase
VKLPNSCSALFVRLVFVCQIFGCLLCVCLPCSAQYLSAAVVRKIEHQMRIAYKLPPSVKVVISEPTPSNEVPGYDSVSINVISGDKQKAYDFLISKDRNTMLRVNKFDIGHDAYADEMSKINVTGRPTRGAKSAKVVLVNFDDFECPFCARLHQTIFPEIFKEYSDRVTFIYKDDPITEIHPWALHAAVDANCLGAQNVDAYWEFADYIHAHHQDVDNEKGLDARIVLLDKLVLQQGQTHNLDQNKLQACVKAQDESAVRASISEAKDLGITGTPAFFVNGQRVDGVQSPADIKLVLDNALHEAEQPLEDSTKSASASK